MKKIKRVIVLIVGMMTLCTACLLAFGCSPNRIAARVDFSSSDFECSVMLREQKNREDITIPYTGEAYEIVAYHIKNGEEYTPPNLLYKAEIFMFDGEKWTKPEEIKERGRYSVDLDFFNPYYNPNKPHQHKYKYYGYVYFTIE